MMEPLQDSQSKNLNNCKQQLEKIVRGEEGQQKSGYLISLQNKSGY